MSKTTALEISTHPKKLLHTEPIHNIQFERTSPDIGFLINCSRMCVESANMEDSSKKKKLKPLFSFKRNIESTNVLKHLRESGISEDKIELNITKRDSLGSMKGEWKHPLYALSLAAWLSPVMLESTLSYIQSQCNLQQQLKTTEDDAWSEVKHLEELREKDSRTIRNLVKKNEFLTLERIGLQEKHKSELAKLEFELNEARGLANKAVENWHKQLQIEKGYLEYQNEWKTVYEYMFARFGIKMTEKETRSLDKLAIETMRKVRQHKFYVLESTQWDKYVELVKSKRALRPGTEVPPEPRKVSGFKMDATDPNRIHVFHREEWKECIMDVGMHIVEKYKQQQNV